MTPADYDFLRLAFTGAERARQHGNHPFGAALVDADGRAFLASENSVVSYRDATAHAELNLIRAATGKYTPEQLSTCTLYASSEPCPMCAGAIVWGNIRRVVFGLGMQALYKEIGDVPGAPSLKLQSRSVFEHAPWPIEVIGPVMETEALLPHKDFW
ncbi:MAG: nucleoside deaminase [Gammaproteobacteria bacterium]|jgi:tRNA(Arg) A34 adenosine deaminase TadA|nr:nucleoside deaminase [Gammaproteobacteria bacterium]